MDTLRNINSPLRIFWIGTSAGLLERSRKVIRAQFVAHSIVQVSELSDHELADLQAGTPIILELDTADSHPEGVAAANRLIRKLLLSAKVPVILCFGRRLPAEIIIDWLRAGVFTYVEHTADDAHLQEAFRLMALRSKEVREQYLRYEELRQLWNSVSDREAPVLDMLMEGLPNKKIANRLGVSQRTIESRRKTLYEKLHSRSIVEVVRTVYELDSLEHIFHRMDAGHDPAEERLPNISRLPQLLPRLSFDSASERALHAQETELPKGLETFE